MGDAHDRRGKRGLRNRHVERVAEDDRRTALGSGITPIAGGGGIFKSAAVAVLRQERKLMTTGDITRIAVEQGLLKCSGKTPEATMASALYTDVKRKLHKSVFTRPQEGLFGLREWIDEGYFPDGWVGPPDGLGLAPFKRRNSGSHARVRHEKPSHDQARMTPGRVSKVRAARTWKETPEISEVDEEVEPGEEVEPEEEEVAGEDEAEEVGEEEVIEEEGTGTVEDEGEDDEMMMDEQPSARDHSPSARQHANLAATRRSARIRGVPMSDDSVPQDDCMSPLHMLGEAAASESMDVGEHQPPAKRRRPGALCIPDGHGPTTSGNGGESMTPKSPYRDSLAALHEIATSPCTFGQHGMLDAATQREMGDAGNACGPGGGGGGGGKGAKGLMRNKPKLVIDVQQPGNSQDSHGRGGLSSFGLGTPSSLLHDMPLLQGETTPAILLHASPITTATGQTAMVLRQAPVIVNIPGGLNSPGGSLLQGLDTPSLVQLQLPDGQDGMPVDLMNCIPASMQTTLISPGGHFMRPGISKASRAEAMAMAASSRGGGPGSRRVSFSGTVGILGPPPPSHPPLQRQAPHTWPPVMSPQQADAELMEIARVQAVVERLESKLGSSHPQVGKAWLALARMFHHVGATGHGGKDKAAAALKRAWAVCHSCAESCGVAVRCEDAFKYLERTTSVWDSVVPTCDSKAE